MPQQGMEMDGAPGGPLNEAITLGGPICLFAFAPDYPQLQTRLAVQMQASQPSG
jgi:hypothetical protein